MGLECQPSEIERLKAELKKVHAQRDAVEQELASHTAQLPRFEGPLVDAEGFPRADVDVAAVRHHRQRIIMLKNDHRALDDRLASLLVQLHAATSKAAAPAAQPNAAQQPQPQASRRAEHVNGAAAAAGGPSPPGQPFALVEEVSGGSPASAAGFAAGDKIVSFADVSGDAPNALQAMSRSLQARVGQLVPVLLLRRGEAVQTQLTPGPWAGQGLLGARVRPL